MKYIALLRGINVSGQKKFPKADQISMLQGLGFNQCQVYLHTGNWILEANYSCIEIKALIEKKIKTTYGWEVPVIVLSAEVLRQVFDECPFALERKQKSYFTLLHQPPTEEAAALLDSFDYPGELVSFTKKCIYFFSENGYGKAKMNNNFLENKLKVKATTRNFNTMRKLIELSNAV